MPPAARLNRRRRGRSALPADLRNPTSLHLMVATVRRPRGLSMTDHSTDAHVSAHTSWRYFDGKSVLITGGTGSFGRHFVRTLLQSAKPRRLVIFSRDEMKQFEMRSDISPLDKDGALRFFIGDVRDQSRLELALRGIEIVIHAA